MSHARPADAATSSCLSESSHAREADSIGVGGICTRRAGQCAANPSLFFAPVSQIETCFRDPPAQSAASARIGALHVKTFLGNAAAHRAEAANAVRLTLLRTLGWRAAGSGGDAGSGADCE